MKKISTGSVSTFRFSRLKNYFLLFTIILILLSSCGYTNTTARLNSQENLTKTLLITTWHNRTNELGLESLYFRVLNSWFKKSRSINVVFTEEEADLKLDGEISSIDLPGLFYDSFDEALEIKVKLTISFTLYDNRNKKILWQEKTFIVYEPFILDPTGEQTQNNKQRALLHIGDEIAEIIYLRAHEIVNNLP
ncbi:MAG: hypothetical protein JRF02_05555 [Deltaproteobacteria bacterium]|nr:hypothetical protein [Deltaproteobacteria bacterium]